MMYMISLSFSSLGRPLGETATFADDSSGGLDRGPGAPLEREQRAAEREGLAPSSRGGRFDRGQDILAVRDLRADIEAFLAHTTARQLSCRTVETYAQELRAALQHAQRQHLPVSEGLLTEALVLQLVSRPLQAGARPAATTFNHRLAVWRRFCAFGVKHLSWPSDPSTTIAQRKDRRSLRTRRVLTLDEVQLLMTVAQRNSDEVLAVRNAAVVAVLFHTGLRVSELVGLNVEQLAELEGVYPRLMSVKRKGDLVQHIPLNAVAAHELRNWAQVREGLAVRSKDEGALFISRKRHRLSVRAVQHVLAQLTDEACLPVAVHPHLLRHSFASALIAAGAPLTAVQHLMAHAKLATTAIYLHADERQARAAVSLLTGIARHETLPSPTLCDATSPNRPEDDIRQYGDERDAM